MSLDPKEGSLDMARKAKFDLGDLVHAGLLKDGEKIFFVSDPAKEAAITKQANGEYKLNNPDGETLSVHAAAQKFLGQEPPTHASQWLRTQTGKTLYQIWQSSQAED